MISFSGIDGAGKTTQIALLTEFCRKNEIRHKVLWARGRCTPGVIFVKNIVRRDQKLDEKGKEEYRLSIHKSPTKRKYLLMASILDLIWYFGIYYRMIDKKYSVFICDRYLWDTYIDFKIDYAEFAFESWLIWKLLCKVAPSPSHSFLFVISPEESIRRGLQKQEAGMQTLEQKTAKLELYKELSQKGLWTDVIDGIRLPNEIFEEIRGKVIHEH